MKNIKVNYKAAAIYLDVIITTTTEALDAFLALKHTLEKDPHNEELQHMVWAQCYTAYEYLEPLFIFMENLKPCPFDLHDKKIILWVKNQTAQAKIKIYGLNMKFDEQIVKDHFSFIDEKSVETKN